MQVLLLQIGGYIIHTDLHQTHINDSQVYPIMSVVHIGIVSLAAVLAAAIAADKPRTEDRPSVIIEIHTTVYHQWIR